MALYLSPAKELEELMMPVHAENESTEAIERGRIPGATAAKPH